MVPGVAWSRVYLIEGRETLALVDSGPPWAAGRVLSYIDSIGRKISDLRLILITHSHPDHTSGALRLSRHTGAAVVAHAGDSRERSNGEASLSYLGIFGSLPVPVPFLERTPVGKIVDDGERMRLDEEIEVIHAPGHTPGSVCYMLGEGRVLFSGDALFSDGRRLSRSLPFPGSNRAAYRSSLARLATLEFGALCGGHGAPLLDRASEALAELLAERPEPPTWGEFLASIPGRLYRGTGFRGEHG